MPIANLKKGITLYYDEFGNDEGEAIVLIQGLNMQCIGYPDQLCEKLTQNNRYRVIRFDNRDTGLSHKCDDGKRINTFAALLRFKLGMKVKGPYTLSDMADDVFQLLDVLKIDNAHFVGASMGGMIAQICALQQHDRVLSLTSVMSTTNAKNLPSAKLKLMRKLIKPRPVEEEALRKHALGLMKACAHPNNYDEAKHTEFLNALIARSTYVDGGRQTCAIMMTKPRTHTLKDVKAPTVVIHGAYDALVPVQHGEATHKAIPNSKFVVIEEMGHELPSQHWDQMVAEIHLVATAGSQSSASSSQTERSASVKGHRPNLPSRGQVDAKHFEPTPETQTGMTQNETAPKIIISDDDNQEGVEYTTGMEIEIEPTDVESSAVAA